MVRTKKHSYVKPKIESINYTGKESDKRKVLNHLRHLVEQQSPSDTELSEKFVVDLFNYISKNYDVVVTMDENYNIYITKGESEYYPCLVAHSDTNQQVHGNPKMMINGDLIYGMDMTYGTQCGLGFDDKAGIAIILNLLDKLQIVKVLIPSDEEIGMIGTQHALLNNTEWFLNISYFIQPDRNGQNLDFIDYSNGVDLYGEDFYEDCLPIISKYGYKKASGIATDVGIIKQFIDVCCVNVSVGYYKEHTNEEVCMISKLMCCHDMIYDLIKHLGITVYHFISELPYSNYKGNLEHKGNSYGYSHYDYDDYYYEDYYPVAEEKIAICDSCLNIISETKNCTYCYEA